MIPDAHLDAELSAMYVTPQHQRSGMGRRLVGTAASAQQRLGATGLITRVMPPIAAHESFMNPVARQPFRNQPSGSTEPIRQHRTDVMREKQ